MNMTMTYDGTMVMPKNFAVVTEDEMTYIEGGMAAWTKAAIIAGVVACGVGLVVALAYGQIALGAKILGFTFKKFAQKLGAAAVATVIAGSLGVSVGVCSAVINLVLML